MRIQRGCEKLRAQDIAQRVTLEPTADETEIPMHILQYPVFVIWRHDAEIRLKPFAPCVRKRANFKATLKHR